MAVIVLKTVFATSGIVNWLTQPTNSLKILSTVTIILFKFDRLTTKTKFSTSMSATLNAAATKMNVKTF